jgi:acyl-CoA thioester hydrolase
MYTSQIRVYFEDTDSAGVVYHANYLKYMERSRSDRLREVGWDVKRIQDELSVSFAVRSVNVQYLLPARLNDQLAVSVELTRLGHASLDVYQEVHRDKDLICTAEIRLAVLDREKFVPTAIPEVISKEIQVWKQA